MKKTFMWILVAALTLSGCSKFKNEEPVPAEAQSEANHGKTEESALKDEDNSKTVKQFVPKREEQTHTMSDFYKDSDNQYLKYIPSDAALVMASKRSNLFDDFYKYYMKKQSEIQKQKYKSLGTDDLSGFRASDDASDNKLGEWGIADKQADHLLYIDDYAMVIIMQLEDAKKTESMFKDNFEMINLMVAMNGFQMDGKPTIKKNITTYTLKSIGMEGANEVFYVSVKIESNKMFVVVCRDAALKIDKYFSPEKKPMAVQKLGKTTDNSLGTLYINNQKISRVLSLISAIPTIGMMTRMFGIAMTEQCYSDYAWMLTAFPETTVDVRYSENSFSIHGNIVITDKSIKDSLDSIKQESLNLTSANDLASLNVQLNFNKLYELMNEAAKRIVDQPLKCASLHSLKQFASTLPELFNSPEGKILVESLKGASLSIPEDGDEKGELAYAGMISADNAQEAVPVVMKLIGSRKARKQKYQKNKLIRMNFPIKIPMVSLPEGNSI
ncbi:MAG: hypothetical protein IKY83_04725, partial [Proteobacteria bacterium]|nr:hypothetical protein [Pseudomonadota bacterium]